MKSTLLLSAAFFIFSCSHPHTHLQDEPEAYRTPSAEGRAELLREIIVNDSMNAALIKEIGERCSKSLIAHYSQGKTLKSKFVEKSLIGLNSPAANSCRQYPHTPLYHYTSSKFIISNFSDPAKRNYSDFISYGRAKESRKPIISINGFSNTIVGVLYVSMYPETSSGYGDHLLTLWAKKDIKVLPSDVFNQFYRFGLVGAVSPELKKVMNELPPEVTEACNMAQIALFIFEDSGADLVDYIPATSANASPYNENGWFYLLNTKAIESHTITGFQKTGVRMAEIEQKFKSENRQCEIPK